VCSDAVETATLLSANEVSTENIVESNQTVDIFADHDTPVESPNSSCTESDTATLTGVTGTDGDHKTSALVGWTGDVSPLLLDLKPAFSVNENKPVDTALKIAVGTEEDKAAVGAVPLVDLMDSRQSSQSAMVDSVLFQAFLQGVAVEVSEISSEQQPVTLRRIGQMFRCLVVGTLAVLRSRAEFKNLSRVDMTVIRAANNNPLKFTVSTDAVLRQLIDNKTDGFLDATLAIEEAFGDIMNHQLAMQAGIQASLADLLKTFDPKIIEKHFEQGIVLQKKAKCWDRYAETYRNTVEEAVENFFGDAFVRAYEQQMNLLKKSRAKRQDG
jgi:type VI secretion system FHA domain protein